MNPESSYNELLVDSLKVPLSAGILSITKGVDHLLVALEAAFPFPRNRLDWDSVPGAIREGEVGLPDGSQMFVAFMRRLIDEQHLNGTVFVLGDGLMDLAVSGKVRDVTDYLLPITDAPQHTYVFPFPNVTWCASLSFEGWMDFGYAPGVRIP